MDNIFISYRRGDSFGVSGRIRDRLVQVFGRKRVFMDVDDIPHGQDFVKVLGEKVAECRVLLAIIGPGWLGATDESGRRRLDDPNDFVRIEIATALARNDIALLPVLIDGARMPSAAELPENMKALTHRNAIELRNTQFGSDAERLIRAIKSTVGSNMPWRKLAAGLSVLAIAGACGWYYWTFHYQPSLAPSAKPRAEASAGSRPAVDVARSVSRLSEIMGPAAGRVEVGIRGGNKVKLGEQVVFEVSSKVAGQLIVIDINARGEVTQIYPNRYLRSDLVARIPAERTVTVPGEGYGFTGFRAVEPVGRGRLIALVQPISEDLVRFQLVEEQTSKGFEPVAAPNTYFDQVVEQITASFGKKGANTSANWAFAITEYEIVK